MNDISIQYDGLTRVLRVGQSFTFGRGTECDLCLDDTDMGISRRSGRIAEDTGVWSVTNLSRKRPLHIVDSVGFAVPLPVAVESMPRSRRVVDTAPMTVLIAGEEWTHALVLHADGITASAAESPAPGTGPQTRTQMPNMTDRRREVLVAMAEGYLRPYPYYDPRPHTYQYIATRLDLTKSQVIKRIEQVRSDLVAAGVLGLEKEVDARRALCEWLLATRALTKADVDWLRQRRH